MQEILRKIGPALRSHGFKGSGQNYRRTEGRLAFVVNVQASASGEDFYVNLGAQPLFIPTDGDGHADPKTLKEYECVFRRRVGVKWRWDMREEEAAKVESTLIAAQADFFGLFSDFEAALSRQTLDELFKRFPAAAMNSRAAMHLARACLAVGDRRKAVELVHLGLKTAPPRASELIADLNSLLKQSR